MTRRQDDRLDLYDFSQQIERLLYSHVDRETLYDEERIVLDVTNRSQWACSARIVMTEMIERRDRDLFTALPFLLQVRTDRLPYHQINVDDYRRQVLRWCSQMTAGQAKKYVLLYGSRLWR